MIHVRTLEDGGQPPREIALLLASFLERAKETLEIAVYDVRLLDETEAIIAKALTAAHERGVNVRLIYNLEREPDADWRVPVPPPPKTDPELVESLPFDTVGIEGWPDLMHHKYVIRDRDAVWTGSTNWTDDSWHREENVIAVVESPGIAIRYQEDFAQLWKKRSVAASGRVPTKPIDVDGTPVRTWFTPKRGEKLAHRIARAIGSAKRRIRIASPIVTSGPILGSLAEAVADKRVDVAGVVDNTQVNEVLAQWRHNAAATWKGPALRAALGGASFSGKRSTPHAPGTVHDYMHAKITVCDDTVFIGSFNLSHSGETNAENVLEIADAALAERLARYIDHVRGKYPAVEVHE